MTGRRGLGALGSCLALGLAGCGGTADAGVSALRVPTHTVYDSGTEAWIMGTIEVDPAGCFRLRSPAGTQYVAFPRREVSTTVDTLTVRGRVYRVGDRFEAAGGGSADRAQGLQVPTGCPSTGLVFISPSPG